jgi:hypothetical protein
LYKLANLPVLGWMVVLPNRWRQDNDFRAMEIVDYEFNDADVYKQYAYDVTLTEGHAGAMHSSVSVITNFGQSLSQY